MELKYVLILFMGFGISIPTMEGMKKKASEKRPREEAVIDGRVQTEPEGELTLGQVAARVFPLIEAKLRGEMQKDIGINALNRAVAHNSPNDIAVLLQNGVDVNGQDFFGRTPCHVAVESNFGQGIQTLLLLLSLPNIRLDLVTIAGQTPLHTAVIGGNQDAAEALLLKQPSLINVRDNDGNTALHLALRFRKIGFVQLLLQKGANKIIQNNLKQKPTDIAASLGLLGLFDPNSN